MCWRTTFRPPLGVLLLAASAATVYAAHGLHAQEPAVIDAALHVERLAGAARAWGDAKYFHPALVGGSSINWDEALVATLPEIRAARTREEYRTAVESLLIRLDDPLTRVVDPQAASAREGTAGARPFDFRRTDDGIVVVTVGSYYGLFAFSVQARLEELGEVVRGASAVVFDLRSQEPTDAYGRIQLAGTFSQIERLLTADTLYTPGEKRRVYYGYESPSAFSSGQYRTGVFIRNGARIAPTGGSRGVPTVFLVNRHAGLLPTALPLQAAGTAWIVYEGDLRSHTIGEVGMVPLAEGLVAQIRRVEPVFRDGTSGSFLPDLVVAHPAEEVRTGGEDRSRSETETRDEALEAALEWAGRPRSRPRERVMVPAAAATLPEQSYPDMRYPDLDHRLLAAFRLWNAVEHFYPYKDLLDHSWEDALPRLLPAFAAAVDAQDYTLAVVAMARAIQDSHAYVSGAVYNEEIVGAGYPPIRVRVIENQPVIVALYDTTAARTAGVRVGDVVVSVDGRPAMERLTEMGSWLSTSTPQSRTDRAALSFMNGPVGSSVRLTLRDLDGHRRDVVLERRPEDYSTLYNRERTGETFQVLQGNIGYVDLDRLTYDQIEPMFEALEETRGIIFDMRGYPLGTVWAIAPRLAEVAAPAALLHTPLIGHGSQAPAMESFFQHVEPAPAELRYRRPTVMLMDERTMSQAEHTGLYLKAANGTRFVGTPTAGADGEIVTVPLPGRMVVGFTGQAVTWPDGRQLQRIGLIPDLEVRPTLSGIQRGIDEVLEAAVRLLSSK